VCWCGLGAYNSIRESYERSTAAQRRVDSTTDIVRSSQQVRRAVDELLRRRGDDFDTGYSVNNISLTNISIRIDRFRARISHLNDLVCLLYPVYTMKLALRALVEPARRALVTSARRALDEQLRECLQYYTIQMTR